MNGNIEKYCEILNSSANNICVIAGPGTGKTNGILIPKAKQIISEKGVHPDDVLIIAFSCMSAQDLKERVQVIEKTPRACTLHSLCLSFLLSENNHDIRKRIETIVIDFEKKCLLSDIKIIFSSINKRVLRKMLEEFSAGWAVTPHDKVFNENDIRKKFKSAVLNWLDEHEAAMMEEIVYNAVDLAKKIDTIFIKKPQYIFIDEFQDLNRLEQEFINILSSKSKLVLVVGDPDQSIYSFKYANPKGIQLLAESDDVENHTLEYSGRCAKKIINIANQVLQQANPGRNVFLKPLPDATDGEVTFQTFQRQEDEFTFTINKILRKIKDGIEPKEIIVLVPRKKLGRDFVDYTKTKKLPDNTSFKFVVKNEYTEIEQEKILLLGIIANPNSILRIRTLAGLKEPNNYSDEFMQLKLKYGSLKEAIKKANPNDFNNRKKKTILLCKKIQEIQQILEEYSRHKGNLNELINEILPSSNEDLLDLRNIIFGLMEEGDTIKTLYSKFLDYSRTLKTKGNVVRVMTLMASKGLEANCVFIIGCNDGNIPGENRSVYLSDFEYKQEQRRLLFVGITRAKKVLTISWSRNILFSQSRGHYTRSVRTITLNGERYSQVAISQFLQGIDFSFR